MISKNVLIQNINMSINMSRGLLICTVYSEDVCYEASLIPNTLGNI